MGLFSWLRNLFGGRVVASSQAEPNRLNERPRAIPQSGGQSTSLPQPTRATRFAPARKLNLALGQFAPMSSADVKSAARGLGSLWRSPWFGRRDLIPPVSDERTALIDRGMVGAGLITPEQLIEVHEVGAKMD